MKGYIYKLIWLLFFVFYMTTTESQSISVSPSILDFHVPSGSTETKTISIENKSSKKMSFQVYLIDWLRDSIGGHQYYKPDTLPQSCAKMVFFNPTYLEIDSGKTGKIEVRMHPPETASNTTMKWAMLAIESIPDYSEYSKDSVKKKELKSVIVTVIQVGVHIYQTPPAAVAKAVDGVRLIVDSAHKGFVYFYMKNTGQVMLNCKAHLELTSLSTGEEIKTDDVVFPVFPGGFRRVQLNLPKELKHREYSLIAILDYGSDMPLEAVQKNIVL